MSEYADFDNNEFIDCTKLLESKKLNQIISDEVCPRRSGEYSSRNIWKEISLWNKKDFVVDSRRS